MANNIDATFLDEDKGQVNFSQLQTLRFIWSYARREKFEFYQAIFALLISAVLTIAAGRLLGLVVEYGVIQRNISWAVFGSSAMFCSEVLSITLSYFSRKRLTTLASNAIYRLREDLSLHLQKVAISYLDRQPQGRLITRLTNDVEGIEELLAGSFGRVAVAFVLVITCAAAMLITDFKLGLILVLSMIPALYYTYIYRFKAHQLNRVTAKAHSAVSSTVAEQLQGISIVRLFSLNDWSDQQVNQQVRNYFDICLETNRFYSLFRPTLAFLSLMPLLTVFIVIGEGLYSVASTGVLISMIRYAERFIRPVFDLSQELQIVQQSIASAERVAVLREVEQEDKNTSDKLVKCNNPNGEIEYINVDLAYIEGQTALSKISLKIKAGQSVGFVGRTGSGKTSCVSLLARLYEATSGKILLDGVDITSYDRESLRSHIGYVTQDVVLFRGTIKENLVADTSSSLDQKLHWACEQTGLTQVLSRSARDLETELDEAGSNLSAGERQLIALTRVLILNPRILILDEATSYMDRWLEERVHLASAKVMQQKTSIIIAHRLETLSRCDQIFVFKNGQIIESGTHAELKNSLGYYADLIRDNLSGC